MRFEVLTAVEMTTLFFWVVTPCGLVGGYQRQPEASALMMEAVYFIEKFVSTYEPTRCHNPEEHYC
jgi:hypothetical protein